MQLSQTIAKLIEYKTSNQAADKAMMESYFVGICPDSVKERSVYSDREFAFRFSEANTGSFSNVVLSLSAVKKYDHKPLVICIVRPARLDFRLANTSFLKRISHSSHALRVDNVKGSFLGHDIAETYEGVENRPQHFDQLFAMHGEFSWEENVERLVEATNAIVARVTRFSGTPAQLQTLIDAPERAAAALQKPAYKEVEERLSQSVQRHLPEIIRAAGIQNVNLRGNAIEQLITGEINAHRADDLVFSLGQSDELLVDIKTKLLDRASAPKAYNIDKMLSMLASSNATFCFFFIGIDVARSVCSARLISIFDPIIIDATRVQMHWAGRASRGVTQLTGDMSSIFAPTYVPSVDVSKGKLLIRSFLDR